MPASNQESGIFLFSPKRVCHLDLFQWFPM